MADTKITALAAITTVDPAADVLPIVDISDTSMAASGTTKKITSNQILGAGGTATLASATITGDLTVRTNKLFVNSTGAGVGTTNILSDFVVQNGSNSRFEIVSQAGGIVIENFNNARNAYLNMTMFADAYIWNRLGSEAMRLNSTGLGVGVVPSAGRGAIQLSAGVGFPATQVASSDANTLDDYVETTFSPTIVGSSTAGSATYSTQVGRATKVGRLVTFQLRVAYSAGTGTGNLRVGGLPFTAGVGSVFTIYAENIALTASNYASASLSSGNTFISVDQLPVGGGAATAVAYDAAGDIQISGSYIV